MIALYKHLKIIEKKFGIEAYNEIVKLLGSQEQRISEIKKSREHWKDEYFKLKGKKDEKQ